ncbi:MAG: hypothetical protein ACI9DO_002671 [Reinekea sp.]|jgi:hypothetical protein
MTHNKLIFLFISGLLSACASNNRSNYVTSIGTEDLTPKKPVNVIIYQERNLEARENKEVFNQAANEILSAHVCCQKPKPYTRKWKTSA